MSCSYSGRLRSTSVSSMRSAKRSCVGAGEEHVVERGARGAEVGEAGRARRDAHPNLRSVRHRHMLRRVDTAGTARPRRWATSSSPATKSRTACWSAAAAPGPAFVVPTAAARQGPGAAVAHATEWFAQLGPRARGAAGAEASRRQSKAAGRRARAAAGFFYLVGGDPGLVAAGAARLAGVDARCSRPGAMARSLAGSSAGAMALCSHTLVRATWPNRFNRRPMRGARRGPGDRGAAALRHVRAQVGRVRARGGCPDLTLLGIDERSAAVWDEATLARRRARARSRSSRARRRRASRAVPRCRGCGSPPVCFRSSDRLGAKSKGHADLELGDPAASTTCTAGAARQSFSSTASARPATWSGASTSSRPRLSHRVYAPDLPGFGRTEKPRARYAIPYFARFIERYMDDRGLRSAAVVGASLGGRIALELALEQPNRVRKLVPGQRARPWRPRPDGADVVRPASRCRASARR